MTARRHGWRWSLVVVALALLASACASGPTKGTIATPKAEVLNVAIGDDDFAVGANRFPVFLFDFDKNPIENAKAEVSFGPVQGDKVPVTATIQATYRRVVSGEYVHTHPDGKVEKHDAGKSFYVVNQVNFDKPGIWAAQVKATLPSGETITGSAAFEVRERTATPAIGERVPATRNTTAKEVADLTEIDSSTPPRPELHHLSVAEALERHRPFVVVFATPTFCTSRLCGPVTDEVAALYPKYHEQVEFIHIEPYDLGLLRSEGKFRLIQATKEWNLQTEPWTFVVDGQGRLSAKFEGLAAREEIERALQSMLSGPS